MFCIDKLSYTTVKLGIYSGAFTFMQIIPGIDI